MIRAYYYALNRGQVHSFEQFISTFASPRMDRLAEDLISWLHTEFGIEYQPNSSLGIHIDTKELERISTQLSQYKLGDEITKKRSKSDPFFQYEK
jgi:hypothetical protein